MASRKLIRTAVEDHVKALQAAGISPEHEALARLATRLAGLLDAGEPPTMTASWARELRATLAALAPKEAAGDSNPDAWLDDLDGSVTPIRHAQGP